MNIGLGSWTALGWTGNKKRKRKLFTGVRYVQKKKKKLDKAY